MAGITLKSLFTEGGILEQAGGLVQTLLKAPLQAAQLKEQRRSQRSREDDVLADQLAKQRQVNLAAGSKFHAGIRAASQKKATSISGIGIRAKEGISAKIIQKVITDPASLKKLAGESTEQFAARRAAAEIKSTQELRGMLSSTDALTENDISTFKEKIRLTIREASAAQKTLARAKEADPDNPVSQEDLAIAIGILEDARAQFPQIFGGIDIQSQDFTAFGGFGTKEFHQLFLDVRQRQAENRGLEFNPDSLEEALQSQGVQNQDIQNQDAQIDSAIKETVDSGSPVGSLSGEDVSKVRSALGKRSLIPDIIKSFQETAVFDATTATQEAALKADRAIKDSDAEFNTNLMQKMERNEDILEVGLPGLEKSFRSAKQEQARSIKTLKQLEDRLTRLQGSTRGVFGEGTVGERSQAKALVDIIKKQKVTNDKLIQKLKVSRQGLSSAFNNFTSQIDSGKPVVPFTTLDLSKGIPNLRDHPNVISAANALNQR